MATITIQLDGSAADQAIARLFGGPAPTTPGQPPPVTPPPSIPFSHRGIPMGNFAALEAATVPVKVDEDDRVKFLGLPAVSQPQQWMDLVDKQFRRAED